MSSEIGDLFHRIAINHDEPIPSLLGIDLNRRVPISEVVLIIRSRHEKMQSSPSQPSQYHNSRSKKQ